MPIDEIHETGVNIHDFNLYTPLFSCIRGDHNAPCKPQPIPALGGCSSVQFVSKNTQVVYIHTRLNVNGFLRDFLNNRES
jgi:hypothetical protein